MRHDDMMHELKKTLHELHAVFEKDPQMLALIASVGAAVGSPSRPRGWRIVTEWLRNMLFFWRS